MRTTAQIQKADLDPDAMPSQYEESREFLHYIFNCCVDQNNMHKFDAFNLKR